MKEIAEPFEIPGQFAESLSYGSGHIHTTHLLRFEEATRSARYILQRINTQVFPRPAELMDNLSRICAHQRQRLEHEAAQDLDRRCLRLVHAKGGALYSVDREGGYWRCFHFVEGSQSLDQVETEEQAFQTARTFGCFAARMSDFEGPDLDITIPDFHNLELRYQTLESAFRADSHGRAGAVQAQYAHAAKWHDALTNAIREERAATLPVRIVHNDCKINNVLLDVESGEGLCAIDLDTVMPGTVVADFGELMRTSSSRSAEDAASLDGMRIELDLVRGVARGYASGIGSLLSASEWNALPLAGSVMALENAIRFLTDHLSGDVYFRIDREAQNLDRACAQLRRVELLEAAREEIREIVAIARREFCGSTHGE